MARKKSTSVSAAGTTISSGDGKLQWLNIRLEEDDIAVILNLAGSVDEFRDELVKLVAGGGNFSVRFEPGENVYKVFVSDSRGEHDSNRYGISSTATECRHAIAATLVKLRLWKSDPDRFAKSGQGLVIR